MSLKVALALMSVLAFSPVSAADLGNGIWSSEIAIRGAAQVVDETRAPIVPVEVITDNPPIPEAVQKEFNEAVLNALIGGSASIDVYVKGDLTGIGPVNGALTLQVFGKPSSTEEDALASVQPEPGSDPGLHAPSLPDAAIGLPDDYAVAWAVMGYLTAALAGLGAGYLLFGVPVWRQGWWQGRLLRQGSAAP